MAMPPRHDAAASREAGVRARAGVGGNWRELESELEFPEEEQCLLKQEKAAPARQADGTKKPDASKKDGMFKLPWFGSWSKTILIWIVLFNTVVFWSLPAHSFVGRMTVLFRLWSVTSVFDENLVLKEKLGVLQGNVSGVEDLRHSLASISGDRETLGQQLADAKKQLEESRNNAQKLQASSEQTLQRAQAAEASLQALRASATNASKSMDDLQNAKLLLSKQATDAKQRADRLAAKLKKLRDAELPLLSDITDGQTDGPAASGGTT